MNDKSSSRIDILFFLILTLISIGFIIINRPHFLYNLAVISIFYIILIFFENNLIIKLESYVKILISITVIFHLAGGQLFNLYITSYWFDNLLHLLGSFSFSLFYYSILCSLFNFKANSRGLIFIIVASLGISGGVFFEVIEFTLDELFNSNNQHGLIDTDLDIIFNIIGSILAGLFMSYKNNKKRRSQ